MVMACVNQMVLFFSLEHSDLGFVSDFDIRNSDLNHNG
jgi:hypothetical protein